MFSVLLYFSSSLSVAHDEKWTANDDHIIETWCEDFEIDFSFSAVWRVGWWRMPASPSWSLPLLTFIWRGSLCRKALLLRRAWWRVLLLHRQWSLWAAQWKSAHVPKHREGSKWNMYAIRCQMGNPIWDHNKRRNGIGLFSWPRRIGRPLCLSNRW